LTLTLASPRISQLLNITEWYEKIKGQYDAHRAELNSLAGVKLLQGLRTVGTAIASVAMAGAGGLAAGGPALAAGGRRILGPELASTSRWSRLKASFGAAINFVKQEGNPEKLPDKDKADLPGTQFDDACSRANFRKMSERRLLEEAAASQVGFDTLFKRMQTDLEEQRAGKDPLSLLMKGTANRVKENIWMKRLLGLIGIGVTAVTIVDVATEQDDNVARLAELLKSDDSEPSVPDSIPTTPADECEKDFTFFRCILTDPKAVDAVFYISCCPRFITDEGPTRASCRFQSEFTVEQKKYKCAHIFSAVDAQVLYYPDDEQAQDGVNISQRACVDTTGIKLRSRESDSFAIACCKNAASLCSDSSVLGLSALYTPPIRKLSRELPSATRKPVAEVAECITCPCPKQVSASSMFA
jgi:hypothetical protein